MSRVAKNPITLPPAVQAQLQPPLLTLSSSKGQLQHKIAKGVEVTLTDNVLTFKAQQRAKSATALAGTTRAVVNNMVHGLEQGFNIKLLLEGVGYRAQLQDQVLNLTLGFSHPVNFKIPAGITIETPTQTEIIIKGIDKQQVGQVAANIRALRPPEPYKGKGVRYSQETIVLKETKKK